MKTLGLGLVLAIVAGGGYFLLRADPADQPAAPDNSGAQQDPVEQQPPEVEPRSAEIKLRAEVDTVPQEDRILLPDQTWAPALNGAKNAPPMDWPPDIPWSPIVDMVTDPHGQQWYHHADGSRSTTTMTFRADLGRMDAVTTVANPTAAVGEEPSVGPILPDPNKKPDPNKNR